MEVLLAASEQRLAQLQRRGECFWERASELLSAAERESMRVALVLQRHELRLGAQTQQLLLQCHTELRHWQESAALAHSALCAQLHERRQSTHDELHWRIFCARLAHASQGALAASPFRAEQLRTSEAALRSRVGCGSILHVAELSLGSAQPSGASSSRSRELLDGLPGDGVEPQVFSNREQLDVAMRALCSEAIATRPARDKAAEAPRLPLFPPNTLLSSTVLNWLSPQQLGMPLADDAIYYVDVDVSAIPSVESAGNLAASPPAELTALRSGDASLWVVSSSSECVEAAVETAVEAAVEAAVEVAEGHRQSSARSSSAQPSSASSVQLLPATVEQLLSLEPSPLEKLSPADAQLVCKMSSATSRRVTSRRVGLRALYLPRGTEDELGEQVGETGEEELAVTAAASSATRQRVRLRQLQPQELSELIHIYLVRQTAGAAYALFPFERRKPALQCILVPASHGHCTLLLLAQSDRQAADGATCVDDALQQRLAPESAGKLSPLLIHLRERRLAERLRHLIEAPAVGVGRALREHPGASVERLEQMLKQVRSMQPI